MLINKKNIAVLLATYNGAKYLRAQLESIFNQSTDDFTLYIRDDGSNDRTLDIIKDFEKQYDNIIVIDNGNKNLGPQMNFMEMLHQVESKYYMFADQDDVWFPDKIKNEYKKIKDLEKKKGRPALVLTNLRLCDANEKVVNDSFWKLIHFSPKLFNDLRSYVFINYATGCTMMFNHETKEKAFPVPSYSPMHDWWITVCVYQNNGNVGFIEEPQMDYRKHGDNATGDFVASQKGKSIRIRLKEMKQLYRLAKHCHVVSNFCDFLYYKYRINHLKAGI